MNQPDKQPQPHLSVKQWAEADRPREKFIALGGEALSSAELLAILIGSGTTRESAVALMRRVLADCHGSLRRLGRMTIDQLKTYNGVGEAKAVTILAACELARRRADEPADRPPKMQSAADIYDVFRRLEDKPTEEFHVLLLSQSLRLIDKVCIARGGLTATTVDIRLVLREALLRNAPCMAVCHNHPSGTVRPSQADDALTQRIRAAAQTMDIRLIDHVIVGDNAYYSYQEQGKL